MPDRGMLKVASTPDGGRLLGLWIGRVLLLPTKGSPEGKAGACPRVRAAVRRGNRRDGAATTRDSIEPVVGSGGQVPRDRLAAAQRHPLGRNCGERLHGARGQRLSARNFPLSGFPFLTSPWFPGLVGKPERGIVDQR